MQNDKSKFKDEFKKRVYRFALEVIKPIDALSKSQACRIMGDQLLRSATSSGANVVESKAANPKKDYINLFRVMP